MAMALLTLVPALVAGVYYQVLWGGLDEVSTAVELNQKFWSGAGGQELVI